MTSSGRLVRRSLLVAAALSLVLATAAWAATWYAPTDTTHTVGGNYSWNYGSSLGETDSGNLHIAYVTDKIPGKGWVTDAGPYQGVYYTRSLDGGTTWTKAKRLNKGTQHGDRSALTAEGDCVYATWVSVASYDAYDPAAPRALWFRSNCVDGDPLSWNPAMRLSGGTGRVDYPVVAADGTNVYVIYTNSGNGKVMFKRSTDNGATWSTSPLATVTRLDFDDPAEGFGAWPGICAGEGEVGTLWLQNPAGKLVARVSTDGGATFGGVTTLEAGNAGANHNWGQCDISSDGKIAFAWTNPTALKVGVYDTGVYGAGVTVATFSSGGTYKGGYGPAPAWSPDASKLGVAWGDCRTAGCDYFSNSDRVDLSWSESADGGATWGARELLATSTVATKRINDYPSVLWLDGTTRLVHYNGWNANYSNYRLYLQVGTG